MRRLFLQLVVIICILVSSVKMTFAQQVDSSRLNAYIDVALGGNRVLKNYNWSMSVEDVQVEASPVTRSFQVRWDEKNNLVKKEISAGNKALPEGTTDWVTVLVDYILPYIAPPESKLVSFYNSANIEPDTGVLMEISGANFIRNDDKVTIDIDRNIFILRRLTFTSVLEDDDLMGTIEYEVDSNGFKYPARVKVDVPAKRLRLNFINSNFVKR
jgi:hypothetical protein